MAEIVAVIKLLVHNRIVRVHKYDDGARVDADDAHLHTKSDDDRTHTIRHKHNDDDNGKFYNNDHDDEEKDDDNYVNDAEYDNDGHINDDDDNDKFTKTPEEF